MIHWKLETRKISDLIPHPKNPRKLSKHDAEHLRTSLERFGMAEKPIINLDGQIIGGHQRLSILKQMKAKEIECWVPDRELSDREVDELCIKLNRVHGEFDFDILANEFNQDDLLKWGFTEADLELDLEPILEDVLDDPPESEKKHSCPKCGFEF